MLGEISTGLNLHVMKQGQDVKTSPPPPSPPPLPLPGRHCVVLKNLWWGQNISLQHVALNSAGLSLCVMKQGHDAEKSPLIWLDFMKRFLFWGARFLPRNMLQHEIQLVWICASWGGYMVTISLALSLPRLLLHLCPGFYHITVKYVG